jgi:hypothetical protein
MEGAARIALQAVFLALLLSCSIAAAAEFSLLSLSVYITANNDGSADVEERIGLLINGSSGRELYDSARASYSDLSTWKDRTQLTEVRHHVTRAKADISDLRITPQAIERCSPFTGYCNATLVISYKINAGQNGSALIHVNRYKPRTALYSLDPEVLSFEQTQTGDLIVPSGTVISITIPQQAQRIYFSSIPANLQNEPPESFRHDRENDPKRYYVGSKRTFSWQGDTLPKFAFTYEIEAPLENEVMDFFRTAQSSLISFVTGPQGLAALVMIAVAAASIYSLNRVNRG